MSKTKQLSKARQEQIAWWAKKVFEQSQEYADIVDPERTFETSLGHHLDSIRKRARQLHFELTKVSL